MVDKVPVTVQLEDHFYRDSFARVTLLMILLLIGLVALTGLALYLYLDKPKPVYFVVGSEWHLLPPVPLTEPYLRTPDLLQWVSTALPQAFNFDFVDYDVQLKQAQKLFTEHGWQNFQGQLSIYADKKVLSESKLFISGKPGGAPVLCNQGLLEGRYGWWVEMPVILSYAGNTTRSDQTLRLQALVVRTSTANDLSGIGIDNVIVKSSGKVCF